MTVRKVFLGGKIYEITGSGYEANGTIERSNDRTIDKKIDSQTMLKSWKQFFLGCFLNAHAKVNPPDAEHLLRYSLGDPTEAALIVLAKKM